MEIQSFEIFTRKFSRIVQATDIKNAVQIFRTTYREQLEIIAVINTKYTTSLLLKEFLS